jgi:hypothetical protein
MAFNPSYSRKQYLKKSKLRPENKTKKSSDGIPFDAGYHTDETIFKAKQMCVPVRNNKKSKIS